MSPSPTTEPQSPGPDAPRYGGLTVATWKKVAVVVGLLAITYWPNLRRLWEKTNPFYGEANWQHAIFVPIVGLYYLYVHREQLFAAKVRAAWEGAGILLIGLLLFGYGIWPGQNDFVKDFGMVVSIFGVVLLLCGWQVMKIAWFPIVFLVCAIPWPGLVYSWIAGPLQELAANAAVVVLRYTGVGASGAGTKIFIAKPTGVRTLNVAEACAGLRSLMTFVSVAAAMAFLSARPLWQKVLITLSAVPIAIFCNVVRVTGQGMLDYWVSSELSENFAHQFVGVVMLIPAFLLILLVGWILDKIFIEEIDRRKVAAVTRGPAVSVTAAPVAPPRTVPLPPARPAIARPAALGRPALSNPARAKSATPPAAPRTAPKRITRPPTKEAS